MSRTAIIVAQVIATLLALGGIAFSFLDRIMKPGSAAADIAVVVAFIAVVVLTIVGLTSKGRAARIALLLTLGAGIAPIVVYQIDRLIDDRRGAAWQRAENAKHDAKALERIMNRTRNVEARLAANKPYTAADAQDALEFVSEVSYVDLAYLGLPDRSGVMLDLLKRALAAKLIDPNITVKGPRPVDVNPEPLFVHYYRANIRPYPKARVRLRDFEVFKLLATSGADLSRAPGFPIAEDLARGLKKDEFGEWRVE